mmetsp:Transcript_11843/g.34185  ORF Transcript_11843/g.34185 Transcript_11843/m.34185 type:complete len:398 (+) Transcript_11843:349-1542(+)
MQTATNAPAQHAMSLQARPVAVAMVGANDSDGMNAQVGASGPGDHGSTAVGVHEKLEDEGSPEFQADHQQQQRQQPGSTDKAKTKAGCCRMLPHGAYSLFIATLTTMAWLTAIVQDGCDYATVTGPGIIDELRVSSPTHLPPFIELGMEAYREPTAVSSGGDKGSEERYDINYSGDCLEYPDKFIAHRMDETWEIARLLKFIALVLGGGGALFIWCSTCFVFSKGTWKILVGYELLLATLCQAASFMWFWNDVCKNQIDMPYARTHQEDPDVDYVTSCSMSWGAKADVASCCVWFFAALMVICYYPQPRPDIEYTQADAMTEDEYDAGDFDPDDDGDNGDELYGGDDSHDGADDDDDGVYDNDHNGHDLALTVDDEAIAVVVQEDFGEPIHPEKEVL